MRQGTICKLLNSYISEDKEELMTRIKRQSWLPTEHLLFSCQPTRQLFIWCKRHNHAIYLPTTIMDNLLLSRRVSNSKVSRIAVGISPGWSFIFVHWGTEGSSPDEQTHKSLKCWYCTQQIPSKLSRTFLYSPYPYPSQCTTFPRTVLPHTCVHNTATLNLAQHTTKLSLCIAGLRRTQEHLF